MTSLRCGIVLRVEEDACQVLGEIVPVRYAAPFPTPRTERVSPGHLVAITGSGVAVWRWYDAVVLGAADDLFTLWEPTHGEVRARLRPGCTAPKPGTRAYLSAGLPGADWWVAGPAVTRAADARVELDEVARFYAAHDLAHHLG